MADPNPLDLEYLKRLEQFGIQDGTRFSNLTDRILANVIDGVFVGLLSFLILMLIPGGWWLHELELVFAVSCLVSIVPYLYSIFLHGKYGRTLGKRLLGLKVLDVSERANIGYRQAFMRDAVPLIGVIGLLLVTYVLYKWDAETQYPFFERAGDWIGVGWFCIEVATAALNPKRRALHDYIAKTVVVKL